MLRRLLTNLLLIPVYFYRYCVSPLTPGSCRYTHASRLNFPDQSFDCVLTRNLTWTLLRPGRAYAEWLRVLRPGGVLLNFDADYGVVNFMDAAKEEGRHAHAGIDSALLREGENIRRSLAISRETRPAWDMAMLRRVGFSSCTCDTALSSRVFAPTQIGRASCRERV